MVIVLGVSGGIAAYKAVALARLLVEGGHDVHVVPTDDALRFVGLPTWEAISRNKVTTSVHDDVAEVRHVALGQRADLVIVAPATANTLAKMATGLADNLLGTTLLATTAPVLVAPAMHTEMWQHPATQTNMATLIARGVHVIGPDSGRLTGADSGPGRMSEPEAIAAEARRLLSPRDLAGLQVVVSAGGTREPIDPVRFLGNRSSGRQGVAVAAAAADRGADVVLVAANIDASVLSDVAGHTSVRIEKAGSAAELQRIVEAEAVGADVVVMAAAVADYRVAEVADGKIVVGFAAETADTEDELLDYGRRKRRRKGVELLAVNRVGWNAGFETATNTRDLIDAADDVIGRAEGSKREAADGLWDAVLTLRDGIG